MSRRKPNKNLRLGKKVVKQLVGLFLLLTGVICFIDCLVQKVAFSTTIFCLVLGFIGFLLFASTLPSFIGKLGEIQVAKVLNKLATKYNGFVINDVIIPDEEADKTSQIDHILFTVYGIFVIETKNYSGRIYGNEKQLEWTQVLNYGKVKNKLYNPVKQNATHCHRLLPIIQDDSLALTSVVVFVKGNTKYIESNAVCSLGELKKLINKKSVPVFNKESVERAYNNVLFYKENKVKSNKEHIKEINQMQKDIQNNICPRCGSKLILKISFNGKEFYGCSNYPKCTFTKKVK